MKDGPCSRSSTQPRSLLGPLQAGGLAAGIIATAIALVILRMG